jgi:UPF0042 nucleotide-binding protein
MTGHVQDPLLAVEFKSFGFKYSDESGDLVFDARFIPNPYYVDSLRPLTGRDPPCADYVFSFPITQRVFALLKELVLTMAQGFQEQGRTSLKIRVGCTGGQHRSVALVEALAKETAAMGYPVSVTHREMEAGRY